jgi:hypothetical protein
VILSPHTGRSVELDMLLSELMDWTMQPPILEALIKNKVADAQGAMKLAAAIRLAIEDKPEGLTETQAAGVMLQMLGNDRVRVKIARHVAKRHGLEEWQAEADLVSMAEYVADKIPSAVETEH